MRKLYEFSQAQKLRLLPGLLACIFLLALSTVGGKSALAAEPPPGGQGEQNAPETKGNPLQDCEGPPVVCVGVKVSLLSFPGCTSGQRCSLDTAGKSCGLPNTGKKCQTVNAGGVCSCQCIR